MKNQACMLLLLPAYALTMCITFGAARENDPTNFYEVLGIEAPTSEMLDSCKE